MKIQEQKFVDRRNGSDDFVVKPTSPDDFNTTNQDDFKVEKKPLVGLSVFNCVLKSSYNGTIKKTKSSKQLKGDFNDIYWFLNSDGVFFTKQSNRVTGPAVDKGVWKCDGPSDFIITLNDGKTFSSKIGEWKVKSNTKNPPITSPENRTNTIKLSDIKNGSKSVKIGAKGSVVTKIQDLLIGLGYNDVSNSGKSDGKFGPKTDAMVKKYQKDNGLNDDGVVGAKTITALLTGKSDATKVEPVVNTTQPDQIQGTDGYIIKEKEKLDILQESVKKLLRKSLLGFRKK